VSGRKLPGWITYNFFLVLFVRIATSFTMSLSFFLSIIQYHFSDGNIHLRDSTFNNQGEKAQITNDSDEARLVKVWDKVCTHCFWGTSIKLYNEMWRHVSLYHMIDVP
jgi:hypothetical protein